MPEPESREPRIASAPLAGSAALVTGGAKRIGRAIALRLAASGANVAITYRNSQPEAEETVRDARGARRRRLRPPHRPHRRREHPPVRRRRHRRVRPARSSGQQRRPLRAGRIARDHARAVGPDLCHQHARALPDGAGRLSSSARSPRTHRQHRLAGRLAPLGHARPLLRLQGRSPHALADHGQGLGAGGQRQLRCAGNDRAGRGRSRLRTLCREDPHARNGAAEDVAAAVLFFATGPHFITGQLLAVDGGLGL